MTYQKVMSPFVVAAMIYLSNSYFYDNHDVTVPLAVFIGLVFYFDLFHPSPEQEQAREEEKWLKNESKKDRLKEKDRKKRVRRIRRIRNKKAGNLFWFI